MKKFISTIALSLALITVLAPLAGISAGAVGDSEPQPKLDYSAELTQRVYVSPSDLLSTLIFDKYTISDAEGDYLDDHFEEYLYHSATIPSSSASLTVEGDSVTVRARAYSYTAKNGKTVTFLPVYVTSGGEEYTLVQKGDGFEVTIPSAQGQIQVYYNGSLPIDKDVANKLLNFTFNEAKSAVASSEQLAEYNRALYEYELYLEAYEKYVKDTEARKEYLEAKALYDEAMILYEKNVEEMKIYEQKLTVYENYLTLYNTYLSDVEKYRAAFAIYEKDAAKYRAYVTNISAIRRSMVPMESLFIDPEKTGPLYNALQNKEMVAMFEKYKSILVESFGVEPSDIDYLSKYSDELNLLLRGYADKRAISEEEAFNYYKANYAQITKLFNGLYEKMDSILNPTIFNLVCTKLEVEYGKEMGEYKKWRVKNVICHIYLICLCLDDTKTVEETWWFYRNDGDPQEYYYSDLLSQELIISDTNASNPANLVWIAPVEEPRAPMPPTAPQKVEKPIKPIEMSKPQEPVFVPEPTEPEAVDMPSLPESYDHDLLLRTGEIMKLLEDAEDPLTLRTEFTADQSYSFVSMLSLNIPASEPTATVYGRDGEIIAAVKDLAKFPAAEQKYSDSRSVYTFIGWSTSPEKHIPLPSALTEDISVYPVYSAEARKYAITFVMNGVSTVREFEVGTYPSYEGISTDKPSDDLYDYAFEDFDTAVTRVSGDKTYTAVYSHSDRIFELTFVSGKKTETRKFVRGSLPEDYPTPVASYIEGDSLYKFSGWDKPLSQVTENAVYTALYDRIILADLDEGEASVTEGVTEYTVDTPYAAVNISELLKLAATNGKTVTVNFSGESASLTLGTSAISSLASAGGRLLVLTRDDDGIGYTVANAKGRLLSVSEDDAILRFEHGYDSDENIFVRAYFSNGLYSDGTAYTTENGVTSVSAASGTKFKTYRRFALTVEPSENGSLLTGGAEYVEGETVNLTVNVHSGYLLSGLKLKNAKTGETVDLGDVRSFEMPPYDAVLYGEFTPKTYTVKFVYHGKTETFTYTLGETPKSPDIPLSYSENGYFYTFTGWSSPIATVTGDATYTAQYFSVKEEDKAIDDSTAIGGLFRRFVIPVASVLAVVLAVTITAVILIVRMKGRKKKTVSDRHKGN